MITRTSDSGAPGAAYLDPSQLQQQIAAAAAVVAQPQPAHTGATGGLAQAVASIPQVVQQGVQQGVVRSQTPKREASSPDTSTGMNFPCYAFSRKIIEVTSMY